MQNTLEAAEPAIRIRTAVQADIHRLADLLGELFSLETDFTPDRQLQRRGLELLAGRQPDASLVLVAERSGVIIGMATVQTLVSTAEGGRVGLVEDVIVDRGHRGRGVGTLLIDAAVSWSKQQRLKRLQLLADRGNARALQFYSRRRWHCTELICLRHML